MNNLYLTAHIILISAKVAEIISHLPQKLTETDCFPIFKFSSHDLENKSLVLKV